MPSSFTTLEMLNYSTVVVHMYIWMHMLLLFLAGFIVWSFIAAILVNDQYIIVVNYSFSQYEKKYLCVLFSTFHLGSILSIVCPCLLDFY